MIGANEGKDHDAIGRQPYGVAVAKLRIRDLVVERHGGIEQPARCLERDLVIAGGRRHDAPDLARGVEPEVRRHRDRTVGRRRGDQAGAIQRRAAGRIVQDVTSAALDAHHRHRQLPASRA